MDNRWYRVVATDDGDVREDGVKLVDGDRYRILWPDAVIEFKNIIVDEQGMAWIKCGMTSPYQFFRICSKQHNLRIQKAITFKE